MIAVSSTEALLGLSWLLAAVLLILCVALLASRAQARSERARLERWLRAHLFLVRASCGQSMEATSIVSAFERALPVLAPIDVEGLAAHLHNIRRRREADLLQAASFVAGKERS